MRLSRFRSTVLLALLLGLALLGHPGRALAVEPGLVGQWHFDSYSGTGINASTPDSSGHGGTGYFAGTPTFSAGRFGSAFNGPVSAEPMMVSRPSGAWGLEPSNAVSVTAWVKRNGDPGVLKYIVAKGDFRYAQTAATAPGAPTRSTRATARRRA